MIEGFFNCSNKGLVEMAYFVIMIKLKINIDVADYPFYGFLSFGMVD